MAKEIHARDSHIGSQVGTSAPVVLRPDKEIFVRDPDGPVKTKGRQNILQDYSVDLKHHKETKRQKEKNVRIVDN